MEKANTGFKLLATLASAAKDKNIPSNGRICVDCTDPITRGTLCAKCRKERGELWQREALNGLEAAMLERGVPKKYLTLTLADSYDGSISVKAGRSYYIHGPNRYGKTGLACALMREVMLEPFEWAEGEYTYSPARFIRAGNFAERITATWGNQPTETAPQIVQELSKARYLTLDDIGSEKRLEGVQGALQEIIDNRLTHDRPLIITSIYDLDELCTLYGQFGKHIAHRINEMCEVVRLTKRLYGTGG